MKKISTVLIFGNEIFKEQKLTIGVDLGDLWSFYCIKDEAGQIISAVLLRADSNLPPPLREALPDNSDAPASA